MNKEDVVNHEDIREIHRGRVIRLTVERVQLPNGRRTELEIAHHPGGAAVVAVDSQERVCLLRQFRHAAGGWLDELPAGKLDGGEPPLACAQRELAEEAGMLSRQWTALGSVRTSPGVLTEVIHLYLARELTPVPARLEADEVLVPRWLPFTEALEQACDGTLEDSKSIVGLVRANHAMRGESSRARSPSGAGGIA